jgi:hypothetical protein
MAITTCDSNTVQSSLCSCGEVVVNGDWHQCIAAKRHGDPRFYQLLEEIAELHSRKNHDYSKTDEPLSNFHRSTNFGIEPWKGILVRMSDKWSRIEELSKGKEPKNESLRDSLIDNAVYSLLCVLLLEDAK